VIPVRFLLRGAVDLVGWEPLFFEVTLISDYPLHVRVPCGWDEVVLRAGVFGSTGMVCWVRLAMHTGHAYCLNRQLSKFKAEVSVVKSATNVVERTDDRFCLLKTKMRQSIAYAHF
jgi:hypothetical protein